MKKTKRLLSALTALTITASAFTGLVIPASAADDGKVHYTQNYETSQIVDWKTSVKGRYDPTMETESNGNHYLTVDQSGTSGAGRYSNGAALTSQDESMAYTGERFAVEFDMKLGSSNDQAGTNFVINANDGYLFKIAQVGKNTTTWRINDMEDLQVTLPNSASTTGTTVAEAIDTLAWYHFTIAYGDGMTYVTIADAEGNEVQKQTLVVTKTTVGSVKDMVFNTSRYWANFAIDNVVIRNLKENEIASTKFYTASINTTRYATMTYGEGEDAVILYADQNGKIEIPLLASGTEINYTLKKTGYDDVTDSFTVGNDNVTVNKPLTATAGGVADGVLYYEGDFGNASQAVVESGRGITNIQLGSIEMPNIATFSMDVNVNKAEEQHWTWLLRNSDGKDVVGLQGITAREGVTESGLIAFTGFTGTNSNQTDLLHSGAIGKYTNSVKIADDYVGSYNVSFTIDNVNKLITVKCGDITQSLVMIEDASKIASMSIGKYRTDSTVTFDNVKVTEPNPNYVQIGGDTDFAKITGKTVTRLYKAAPVVVVPDETFTWTVVGKTTGEAVTGASIDENGMLSVTDEVTPGVLTITATSSVSAEKKGSIDVDIHDVADLIPTIEGPKTMQPGETGKIKVTGIVDQYGDDVTDYFTPTYSIDGVDSIDSDVEFDVTGKSGDAVAISVIKDEDGVVKSVSSENVTIDGDTLTVTAEGGATVMLWNSLDGMTPMSNEVKIAELVEIGEDITAAVGAKSGVIKTGKAGTAIIKVKLSESQTDDYEITIANYSKIVENPNAGDINVDDIVTYGASTYTITRADGTSFVKEASDNKIALTDGDINGTDKIEIVPNYKFNLGDSSVEGYVSVNALKSNGYGFTSAPTVTAGAGTGVQADGVDLDSNSFEVDLPDGRYDMTFYKADTNRTHIRVNDYMTVTEADFNDGDDDAVDPITGPGVYTKLDVNVAGGVAKINAYNWNKGVPLMAAVEITRKSDLEPRKKHIWIAGDSTVCIYRPSPTTDNFAAGTRRTGWGQLFQYYVDDSVIVDDFAHSGDWAKNWYENTFPSVIQNAEAGDYLIIQFGINDRTRTPNEADMKAALVAMVDECRAKGVIPVLQTPELCISQYGDWKGKGEHDKPDGSGHGKYFAVNRTVAAEKNVLLIDLADISATMWATMGKTWVTRNYFVYESAGVTDNQHMSYQGAKLVASMVATEILDQKEAGNHGASGETFDNIPVNAKVQADVTYTDASDNVQKTITRQAAEFKMPSNE